jgi:protein TonB
MRNRTLKPFFIFLGFSVLIHWGIFWLDAARLGQASLEPARTALVNLLPASSGDAGSPAAPPRTEPAAAGDSAPQALPPAPEPPGSDSATAPGGENSREDPLARYIMMIRSLIDSRKEYPYQARRQEQEGTVLIRFTLSRQGYLIGEPVVEKKSRWRILDESALRAVQDAAPYPPFPGEAAEEQISFQVAVSFALQ